MRLRKIFRVAFVAVVISALLSSCSNLFDKGDDTGSPTTSQKGCLLFSMNSAVRSASTVNPIRFYLAGTDGLTFLLTGTFNGTSSTLGSWSDSDDAKAYALMTTDTSVLVDVGDWKFRLSVTKDGREVLYGIKELAVKAGNNTLDFGALSEASEDDETRSSEIGVAQGNVNFTLLFPKDDGVLGAAASLISYDSNEVDVETLLKIEDSELSDLENSVTYTANKDAGTYILAISLYSDSETLDDTTWLNTYTAIVNIAPGCESRGTRELTDVNTLCTITYELNGGSFEDTVQTTSYNRHTKFTLPAPVRTGYKFAGWSTTEAVSGVSSADYSAGKEITIAEAGAIFYAIWIPISYTISYNLGVDDDGTAANSDSNVKTYTIESDVKLYAPEYGDNAFSGWYESSDFSTAKTTGWSAGEKTGNITLYAKWNGTKVTADTIVEQIKAMTESGTLKASGEFSTDLIEEINKALKELARRQDVEVLVTLDLSDVTGLEKLEGANSVEATNNSFYECTNLAGIVLPDSVTNIEFSAFSGCTSLATVTIPDSVTSIGSYTFYKCTSLKSVTIPDSVTSIESGAFNGCTSLASVYYNGTLEQWLGISFVSYYSNPCCYGADLYIKGEKLVEAKIPDTVTSIGNYVFDNCKSLESVTIPDSVTSIGYDAFKCTSLESVTIPDSVTSIGGYAFYGCTSLATVTIPDSVTNIGSYAFYKCTSLKSVTIPDSVTSIGSGAFSGCTSLTGVTIPDKVTSVGSNTFNGCTSLESVTIPDSVTSIGDGAFSGCTSLTGVTIPDKVTSVGNDAFSGCTKLKTIAIPDSVTSIGYDAFSGCSSLIEMTIPFVGGSANATEGAQNSLFGYIFGTASYDGGTDTKQYYQYESSISSITYYIPSSLKMVTVTGGSILYGAFYNCSNITEINLGNKITGYISKYAFYKCTSLESVTIPDSVTSIGGYAFYGCTSLASVTIPDSVRGIGDYAFFWCTSLASVTIPDSVTYIGDNAFDGCTSLASVTIPDSVTYIGSNAFNGCTSLKSVTIPASVTSIGNYAFYKCTSIASVYCNGTLEQWLGISFVSYYSNPCCYGADLYITGEKLVDAELPDTVTSIGNYAFYRCTSLVTVTIPASVTSIGSYAFSGCTSLANITIPNSATSIGSYAFSGCTSLANITIPDSVTSIGGGAFSGCTSLTGVTIPDKVTSIGSSAFQECTSLASVYYNGTLEQWLGISFVSYYSNPCCYGADLYINGEKLVDAKIPETVTSIGAYAFYNYKSLESVTIPGSVTSIGSSAFYKCTSLESVTILDGVVSIPEYVFSGCTSLSSVTIPDSVTSIGSNAFNGCTSLESVTIPDSVTSIGSGVFYKCTALAEITIPFVGSSAGMTEASKTTLFGYIFGTASYDGGTSINQYYASSSYATYCIPSTLKKVTVTGGNILYGAFYGCNNITCIILPDSLTGIGENVLSGCSSLEELTIPFVGSSIDATEASKTTLFGYIFGTASYDGGTSTKQYYASLSSATYATYCIPSSLKKVTVTGGNILYGTFENCSNITDITIGGNVTSIGSFAFYGCTSLASITITASVASIGSYAFDECTSLKSVTIPASVTSIGNYAFQECTSLASVYYNGTLEQWLGISFVSYYSNPCYYGADLYINGEKLVDAKIPDTVTSIGDYAFYGCKSITSIEIPESVTKIGHYAFYKCANLASATFNATSTWYYTSSSDYDGGTAILSTPLKDTSTAAEYLRTTYYYEYYWYKK